MIFETHYEEIRRLSTKNRRMLGTVINNIDPEQKSRLQVFIVNYTDKIDSEDLPWYPTLNLINQYQTEIPSIGTRVIVELDNVYNGLIIGSLVSITP